LRRRHRGARAAAAGRFAARVADVAAFRGMGWGAPRVRDPRINY
jgi:hypothetical protein